MIEKPRMSSQIISALVKLKLSRSPTGMKGESDKTQIHIGAELFNTIDDVIDEYIRP